MKLPDGYLDPLVPADLAERDRIQDARVAQAIADGAPHLEGLELSNDEIVARTHGGPWWWDQEKNA